ncbi:BTAD domain-containing putative transcriptional regulator [Thermomonospora cellulosilytica]|uniref:Putative ATPase/DNA-binding SARP family transcriptional activator n=1 Tax=Thermomonospora cellulosilytica TaxID=1411118 RepID=A0A7W3MY01_9ACTN|nr:BTAD domain-containing putative transcriptional regulator [Thermomonospora cellulosilytica]MBA9003941.1 putative ATPase/DNA-binding SARP family transcriptional activator [Thermomonospora cellulosilytica]
MRFGVLGPLAVWTDEGAAVPVPGLKVRALLADLLVHEGRPVPADRLIDDLWGGHPPGNPPAALSAKVSQLRRVLEDAEPGARALVASRPAGYLLEADPQRVDALRFRALLERARGQAEPAGKAAVLAEALALWRGPAFADFADEPFTQAAAARLEELRLVALEDHAEVRLALGEHAVLAGELGDLAAAHPLRERLRALHMRALYGAGRQSEALEEFERLRAALADELGLDPGPELVALQRAILNQDPALDAPAAPAPVSAVRAPTNLHPPATPLIGRDEAVAELTARLGAERLVTLTGPGGVGKTRLAVETAHRMSEAFRDGVWLVELAGYDRPTAAELADVVARVLEIRDAPGASLVEALAARRLLLVLDNCEHVVEQAAELAGGLLRAAPGLTVLATSREPLDLPGEVVWNVPPLEVPGRDAEPDPDALAAAGAVRLFVARASAAARDFRLDEGNAAAVAVLCRRLDGIPLALELAATRVRALGVHGLVSRLDDRFRLLATGQRGTPLRQRTLQAMIGWSWDLLTGPERAVLRRLAVHADGCTLEAAEAVCAGADVPADDVLDLLVRLVDRSLVVMTDDAGPRYRLLESVAAYCVDRLDEAGEHAEVRLRHRRHYVGLAERAEPELYGPEQARWLGVLDTEAANLRAAFDDAIAHRDADGALRLANALTWYWFLRGRLGEARRALAAALGLAGGPAAPRARAAAWLVGFEALQGDLAGWVGRRDEALRRLEKAGDPAALARARWFMAFTGGEGADLATGQELLDSAEEGFRACGDRWGEAAVLVQRALYVHSRGDLAALRRCTERAARLFDEIGDRWGRLQAATWLGAHAELSGDLDRAERLQADALRQAEELRLWPDVAMLLGWMGWVAMLRGDHRAARARCERLLRLAAEQGYRSARELAEVTLAWTAARSGELEAAEDLLHPLLESADRAPGDAPPMHLTLVLAGLGQVAERRGDADLTWKHYHEALTIAARYDAPRDTAFSLQGMAGARILAGRHAEAARLLGTAAAIRRAHGLAPGASERADIDRLTDLVRAALPEPEFGAEYERGAVLSPADWL